MGQFKKAIITKITFSSIEIARLGKRSPLCSYIKIKCPLCYGLSRSTSTNVEGDVLGYGGDTCAFDFSTRFLDGEVVAKVVIP